MWSRYEVIKDVIHLSSYITSSHTEILISALLALKKRLMFNRFVGQMMQMNFTLSYATQYFFHDILWYVSLNFRTHHLLHIWNVEKFIAI